MPSVLESHRIENIMRGVEWIEYALDKFYKIFESYLANWGLVPDKIYQNPHETFFLDLLPVFSEPIVKPQKPININLEVIYIEEKEPVNIIDAAVPLNSSHDFDLKIIR